MQIEREGIVWDNIFMGGIAWSKEEDHLLKKCKQQYGIGKWQRIPIFAGLNRSPKSCRLRWVNYLRPNIKRGSSAEEEIDLIMKFHSLLDNRWSLIASRLPGRTGNDIKNYWNCHLSKRLMNYSQDNKVKQIMTKVEVFKAKPRFKAKNLQSQRHEESSSSTPSLLLQPVEVDEQCYQPLHKEESKQMQNAEGSGEQLGTVIDSPIDLEFQQVKVTHESSCSKWDLILDDLIFDLDI